MASRSDEGYVPSATGAVNVNWRDHIVSDPKVLTGKPAIRGTRLAVDFLLGLLAEGWTEAEILENYPRLAPESLRAVDAYAAEVLANDAVQAVAPKRGA